MAKENITLIFSPSMLNKPYSEPPLSIAFFAELLKGNGFHVTSFNLNNYFSFEQDELYILKQSLKLIEGTNPDYIVISSWTFSMPFTLELVTQLKKIRPKTIIILGGHNATFTPNEIFNLTNDIDFLIRGEGFETIVELITALSHNKSYFHIKGISYKRDEKIIHNGFKEKSNNLLDLPLLTFSSFQKLKNEFYLLFSFGCSHNCSFCSNPVFFGKPRTFAISYLINQIRLLKKLFVDIEIHFWDSYLTEDKEYGKKFCKELIKHNINIKWQCYSRIDTITKDHVYLLKQAGCRAIFFGIESVNPKTLLLYQKTKNSKEYLKSINKSLQILKEIDIQPIFSFIIGSPLENQRELRNNIYEMKQIKNKFPKLIFELSLLTPEINTPLWFLYKSKLQKIENKKLTTFYAGKQLFTEKYQDYPCFTPQLYLYKNKYLSNYEFENILLFIYDQFIKERLYY